MLCSYSNCNSLLAINGYYLSMDGIKNIRYINVQKPTFMFGSTRSKLKRNKDNRNTQESKCRNIGVSKQWDNTKSSFIHVRAASLTLDELDQPCDMDGLHVMRLRIKNKTQSPLKMEKYSVIFAS